MGDLLKDIPKEYCGHVLNENELVQLGELSCSKKENLFQNITYLWNSLWKGYGEALKRYQEFYTDRAVTIIKEYNNLAVDEIFKNLNSQSIDGEKGQNSVKNAKRDISEWLGNTKLLFDAKGSFAFTASEIFSFCCLKEQYQAKNLGWMEKLFSEEYKQLNELSKCDLKDRKKWTALNQLHHLYREAAIGDENFIEILRSICSKKEEKILSTEIRESDIANMKSFVARYRSLAQGGYQSGLNKMEMAKKLYYLQQSGGDKKGLESFLLEEQPSLLSLLPDTGKLSEEEFSALVSIQGMLSRGANKRLDPPAGLLVGCRSFAEVGEKLERFAKERQKFEAFSQSIGISVEELNQAPSEGKEKLFALILLYGHFFSEGDRVQLLQKPQEVPLTQYIEQLENAPLTKKYQAIQLTMNEYAKWGEKQIGGIEGLDALRETLINIPEEQFQQQFEEHKEKFNLKQLESVQIKWREELGSVIMNLLYSSFSNEVLDGKRHYLSEFQPSSGLNELAQASLEWEKNGVKKELHEIVEQEWRTSTYPEQLPKNAPSNDERLKGISQVMDAFGKEVAAKLSRIGWKPIQEVRSSYEKMGLEKVYQNKVLPFLLKMDQRELLAKVERLKNEYEAISNPEEKKEPFHDFVQRVVAQSKRDSLASAIQPLQKAINEKYLKEFFPKNSALPAEFNTDAAKALTEKHFPQIISGEISYSENHFAGLPLSAKAMMVVSHLPLWKRVGFDEDFMARFVREIPDDQLLQALKGISKLAAWVDQPWRLQDKSVREKQLYRELLLEFHDYIRLDPKSDLDAAMVPLTTLMNSCLAQDPKGIYPPSVMAKGLKRKLDAMKIQGKGPKEILAAYIQQHQTGLVVGDRFNNKHDVEFFKIYHAVFVEECAKEILNPLSQEQVKFFQGLFSKREQLPANEQVMSYIKEVVTFAATLLKTGKYTNIDIFNSINNQTTLNIETLNQKSLSFSPQIQEAIQTRLNKVSKVKPVGVTAALKDNPAALIHAFATHLMKELVKTEDQSYLVKFSQSLKEMEEPFNRNPFVTDGVDLLISVIDNPYIPLSQFANSGNVKELFNTLNTLIKEVRELPVTLEMGGQLTSSQVFCKGLLSGVAKSIAETVRISEKVEESGSGGGKAILTAISTAVAWKEWIRSFVKDWIPSIAENAQDLGAGGMISTLAVKSFQGYIYLKGKNMNANVQELISLAPEPVLRGVLLALPKLIKMIEVDEYLEFLEFVNRQLTKEQQDDPEKVEAKLLAIAQVLATDLAKFTPMLQASVEEVMSKAQKN